MNNNLTPFTLAVMLIRLIGLVLLLIYIPHTTSQVLYIVLNSDQPGMAALDLTSLYWAATPLLVMIVAAFSFFRATVIARLLTRGLHPPGHCQRCGYNLAAIGKTHCPECRHDDAPDTDTSQGSPA
jgi:hypothetical protein